MQIRNKGVCRSFIDFIPYSMKNMHQIFIAVHLFFYYTNIDVYKRQIKSCDFYGFELYLKEASGSDETSYSEPDDTSSPETEANMEDETKAPANGVSENNTTVSTDKTDGGSSDNSSDTNSANKNPPAPDTSDASILLFAVIAIS